MKDSYYVQDADGDVVAMAFLTPYVVPVDEGMEKRIWYLLCRVAVPRLFNRGKGYGSEVLQMVCAAADEEQVGLLLAIDPDPVIGRKGLTYDQLRKWYHKHGFMDHKDNVMLREPRPIQES